MSNNKVITLSITVEVENEDAFRAAAVDFAKKTIGNDHGFDPSSLKDCALMLFDPGVSPDGCSILSSQIEDFDGELDDDDEEDEGEDEEE